MMAAQALEGTPGCAAVLWTGGKDSCLALYEATRLGFDVRQLVTFVPSTPQFRAHPLPFMRLQADALGIPHRTLEVQQPYESSYQAGIQKLRDRWGIGTLITGDLRPVSGHPNWISQCARSTGTEILMPLWARDGVEVLTSFVELGFRAIVSYIRTSCMTTDWVGKELDTEALRELSGLAVQKGFDVCGEQGEYHTLVVDGPLFQKRIHIEIYTTTTSEDIAYLEMEAVLLGDRPACFPVELAASRTGQTATDQSGHPSARWGGFLTCPDDDG
jgi:diphthine-ammonia ligase